MTIEDIEITNVREAGGNRHEDRILTGSIEGTMEGTFEQHTSGVIDQSGRVVFRGEKTVTGRIEDCGEGTIHGRLSGKGQTQPEEGPSPVTEVSFRLVNHAANTIDVTGRGTGSQRGPIIDYDIQYNCKE